MCVPRGACLSPEKMLATINGNNRTGHALGGVADQKASQRAHVVNIHEHMLRCDGRSLCEKVVEAIDAASRSRSDGSRRNGVNANTLASELGGNITNGTFKRSLDGSHQIVVGSYPVRTVEGGRKERAARRHQRLRQAGNAKERVDRHVHRYGKT